MQPTFINGNVRANCPTCGGAVSTFANTFRGTEFGSLVLQGNHEFNGIRCDRIIYQLMQCAGCGTGAMAELHIPERHNYLQGVLEHFYPRTIDKLPLPDGVPDGIINEFREAELCGSVGAWRAGSALLRSTLEKTLKVNGYTAAPNLAARIDNALKDGVITAAHAKRAHDEIRVLGNDILHDEWEAVTEESFNLAHRYAQRILEDFYDERPSVEAILIEKGRLARPRGP